MLSIYEAKVLNGTNRQIAKIIIHATDYYVADEIAHAMLWRYLEENKSHKLEVNII